MATTETEVPTPVIEYKAGPVFRQLQTEITQAFLKSDRKAYDACIVKYDALKKLMDETRHQIVAAYDTATSGYLDTEWLNGIERLVKKSETPRGRKPAKKVDPADLV